MLTGSGQARGDVLFLVGRLVAEHRHLAWLTGVGDHVAIDLLKQGCSWLQRSPVTLEAFGVQARGGLTAAVPGQIKAAAMAVHAQGRAQLERGLAGFGHQIQQGCQSQLGLLANQWADHSLGHGPHLQDQPAWPGFCHEPGLLRIVFVLIDRQPKPFLTGRGEGEIGRAAAIDHQAVAHGGGGAVQINHHLAGSGPLRSKA